ncbi:glycosyltransferase family 2 protein [Elizabethkingia ursingii]|uniref:glycosyltransferase family 2 protein n=1 Tax=Elizabethkingia ursingii TaxID=1756150 RepID=UPI002011B850|nr:glycosyltransferase [Elizabethkingia ursingii]MCL1665336.1 glycosyltransferase [Elizabethkingia ursingii]
MISIVTAYYNRKKIFIRTLESISKSEYTDEYEVVVIDDGSREEERLEDQIIRFPFLKVIRLEPDRKWYNNSCVPFNIGFKEVKGDKIVIQNPECFHFDDVLACVRDNLEQGTYLSFGCYSLDKKSTDEDELFWDRRYIEETIANNDYIVKEDGELGWYNHSIYRPEAYHFCTALTKNDLNKLQGFDERFALGIAYDDDEFILRIKRKLQITFVDKCRVLHQNHYNAESTSYQNRSNKEALFKYNKSVLDNRFLFSFNQIIWLTGGKTTTIKLINLTERYINKCIYPFAKILRKIKKKLT